MKYLPVNCGKRTAEMRITKLLIKTQMCMTLCDFNTFYTVESSYKKELVWQILC